MPDVETSCFPGCLGGCSFSLKAGSGQTSAFEEAYFERSTGPKKSARLKQVLAIVNPHPAMWSGAPGRPGGSLLALDLQHAVQILGIANARQTEGRLRYLSIAT